MIRLSARPRQSDWLDPAQWEKARLNRPTLLPMATHPSPRQFAWQRVSAMLVGFICWFALFGWWFS
ncbi:hypothetical protein KZ820_14240 [Sphingomonas sp. RRHST34]|uniref:Uncharacterized protein n=1 Tax=Sphingomonas citri TaxID=2862499 RepID=A0ABS7BR05_9SPHN|nr:hypothetical protein [Sphingomonas citri]MBW6531897.1 hypothetical protein [Sphingomonas citri]